MWFKSYIHCMRFKVKYHLLSYIVQKIHNKMPKKSNFTTAAVALNNKAHLFIFWHQCPLHLDLGRSGQIALAFYQHVNLYKTTIAYAYVFRVLEQFVTSLLKENTPISACHETTRVLWLLIGLSRLVHCLWKSLAL